MATSRGSVGSRGKAVYIAQQLHFANALAGNDPHQRIRAMKKLRKFLNARSCGNFSFTEDDFMRIWKGLFYCMWMSDKPLIQEELCEEISGLVHVFTPTDKGLLFIKTFFMTIVNEWYGIDFHRIEKFLMFVRRFLRQSFTYCKKKKWSTKAVVGLSDIFGDTILSVSENEKGTFDISLIMHFIDIFLEELAKVGTEKLPQEVLLELLIPFIVNLSKQKDVRIINEIRTNIFETLIKQSPLGIEYDEKYEAWKRAGFPGTSWKDMEFIGEEDNRSGVLMKNLDPRAGRVNVYFPHLSFDATQVADLIKSFEKDIDYTLNKAVFRKIIKKFEILATGKYPLVQQIPRSALKKNKYRFSKDMINRATEELVMFNEELEERNKALEKQLMKRKKSSHGPRAKTKKMKMDGLAGAIGKENLQQKKKDNSCSPENGDSLPNEFLQGSFKNNKKSKKKGKRKRMQNDMSWSVSEMNTSSNKLNGSGEDENKHASVSDKNGNDTISDISPEECVNNTLSEVADFGMEDETQETSVASAVEERNMDIIETTTANRIVVTPIRRSARRSMNKVSLEEENIVGSPVSGSIHESNSSNASHISDGINEVLELNGVNENQEVDSSVNEAALSSEKNLKQSLRGKTGSKVLNKEENDNESSLEASTFVPDSEVQSNKSDENETESENDVLTSNEVLTKEEETPTLAKVEEVLVQKKRTSLSPKGYIMKRRLSMRKSTPVSGKRVNIVLEMNQFQAVAEYRAALRQSPSVPHDANKMPCKGVLKRTSIKSPINPFYKPPKGVKLFL